MTQPVTRTFHPLDPLNASEFRQAASILRRDHGVGDRWRLTSMELAEPTKQEIATFDADGTKPDRRAIVVCFDRDANSTYKAIVSLSEDQAVSWSHLPGIQANFTVDEWRESDEFLRNHPDVIAALRRRGVTDMDDIIMDVWTYGETLVPDKYRGRRLCWSDTWVKTRGGANPYAHHLRGFHCIMDSNTLELLEIEEGEPSDLPEVMAE